ncbi:MAG: YfaZ family outer membrane protein [Gammaproteobacteria bacterium]
MSGTASAPRRSPILGILSLACAAALLVHADASAQPDRRTTRSSDSTEEFQVVEAYLSEDALQVLYGRKLDVGELGRNDARAGVFINEDRDLIGIADMLFEVGEQRRRPGWSLQIGPRAYGALISIENQDIFAIALGGTLTYRFGRRRAAGVSLTAFYAPDIVTFGNADNIKDGLARFEARVSDTTDLFIGYRIFEFDLDVDREVDDNMHVGVRHRF